jgi:hypothetical protein
MGPIKILIVEDVELDAELTEYELKHAKINYIQNVLRKNLILRGSLKNLNPT